MKRISMVLVLAVIVSVASYAIYYRTATLSAQAMLRRDGSGLEWLRREFHLSDDRFSTIRKLHDDYEATCERMCRRIAEANAKASELIVESRSVTPELEGALQECAKVQEECHRAMLGHVYAVAAQMPAEDGARFITLMKVQILTPGVSHQRVIARAHDL